MTDNEKVTLTKIAYAMQDYCTATDDMNPDEEILVPSSRVLTWAAKILDLTSKRKPNIYRQYDANYRVHPEFWNKRGISSGLELFKKDVEQLCESVRFVDQLLNAEKPLSAASHAWNSSKYKVGKWKDNIDSAYKAFKENPTEQTADQLGDAITESCPVLESAAIAIYKNQFCKHFAQLKKEKQDDGG